MTALDFEYSSTAERLFGGLEGQLPFAASVAINDTAKKIQAVQVAHMRRVFTERNRLFISRGVKIKPFATKRRLEAHVSIDPPGSGTEDILTKFEKGGRKRPIRGEWLAIPISSTVRRTKSGRVTRSQALKAFKPFHRRGQTVRGQRRTFIVRRRGFNDRILLQRFGRRGRGSIRALYLFRRSVRISASLEFIPNSTKTFKREYEDAWRKAWNRAVRTSYHRR